MYEGLETLQQLFHIEMWRVNTLFIVDWTCREGQYPKSAARNKSPQLMKPNMQQTQNQQWEVKVCIIGGQGDQHPVVTARANNMEMEEEQDMPFPLDYYNDTQRYSVLHL
jgi:hypothetical protein